MTETLSSLLARKKEFFMLKNQGAEWAGFEMGDDGDRGIWSRSGVRWHH